MRIILWQKLLPNKNFVHLVFKGESRQPKEKAAKRTSTSRTKLAKSSASSHRSRSLCNLAQRLYFTCFLQLSWFGLDIFPAACNLAFPQAGPRGSLVDHGLPSAWLLLPSARCGPQLVATMRRLFPIVPNGVCVLWCLTVWAATISPEGKGSFCFMENNGWWWPVQKGTTLHGGKTITTTTKQLLVTKTNSKYGHSYEASGRKAPIVPGPLFRQTERKVGGTMLCLLHQWGNKPGALSLEEWWRGKWTCALSESRAQDKKVVEQEGCAVTSNKPGALSSWSLHQN